MQAKSPEPPMRPHNIRARNRDANKIPFKFMTKLCMYLIALKEKKSVI
jgi:hypothetical protein